MDNQLEGKTEDLRLVPRFIKGIKDLFLLVGHWLVWFFDVVFLGILGGIVSLIKRNRKVTVSAKVIVSSCLIFLFFTVSGDFLLSTAGKILSYSPVKLVEIKSYPDPPDRIWVTQTAQDFAKELRAKHGLVVTSKDIIGGKEITYRKIPGRYLREGSRVEYEIAEGKTKVHVKNG